MYAANALKNGYRNKPSVICALKNLAKTNTLIATEWAVRMSVGVRGALGSLLTWLGGEREARRGRLFSGGDMSSRGGGLAEEERESSSDGRTETRLVSSAGRHLARLVVTGHV